MQLARPLSISFSLVSQAKACIGYWKKGRFGTLYKVLVSISLGGALLDDCWLNIDFVLELGSKPPSIESSNSLSEIVPPPISCHASCFSELVPSVSQSRFTIKRGKSLYFRLGRSRHSRNFLVHRSIARVRIQSAQHIANEKSVHPGWFSWIKISIMIACLFIRSKSPRPFHALLLRGVPWAKTFFYTSSRAAFMAIITSFFRGHGMALFLVLFNRCRVPPFPARESPSALSGRAIALPYGQVGCSKDFLFTP